MAAKDENSPENSMYPTNDGIEEKEHFLLLYPAIDVQQPDLLTGALDILRPFVQTNTLLNDILVASLLPTSFLLFLIFFLYICFTVNVGRGKFFFCNLFFFYK